MDPAVVIPVLAVAAVLPAWIASRKGHSFATYYVFGLILWIVAVPFALIVKDARPKCPDCREVVDPQAVRCPHCQANMVVQ